MSNDNPVLAQDIQHLTDAIGHLADKMDDIDIGVCFLDHAAIQIFTALRAENNQKNIKDKAQISRAYAIASEMEKERNAILDKKRGAKWNN